MIEQPAKPGTDTGNAADAADGATDGTTDGTTDGGSGPFCGGAASGTLNTFIGMTTALEIDQVTNNLGPNANLFVGADPADGSASYQKPVVSGATYIDWDNLGSSTASLANHRIMDVYAGNGEKDPSAFPGADSCVGPAQNPEKTELLYVGAANNNEQLYLNVLRASNLGDMGYTWIFSKEKPSCGAKGTCDNWLDFNLTPGDVLVFGHFGTSGTQELKTYTYKPTLPSVQPATSAIDWGPAMGIWEAGPTGPVAVNSDDTRAGTWGSAGVKKVVNGGIDLEPHVFAEGAVPTSVFGSGSVCGKSFWATIISKSSGTTSGGADMKDLIGPKKLNFGAVVGTASAAPTCDGKADLKASATDGGSPPIAVTAKCTWYEVSSGVKTPIPGLTADQCDNPGVTFSDGTHNLSVTITDAGNSGCATTIDNISVTTLGLPTVTPTLTPDCNSSIAYSATTGNTQGTVTVQWEFDNGVTKPAAGASGTLTSLTGGTEYTGTVEVKDVRSDGKGSTMDCKQTASAKATPYAPISLTLTPAAQSLTCQSTPAVSSDAVTFTATVSGGLPPYSYTWTGCTTPSTTNECTVNPADSTLCVNQGVSVTVDDSSTLCAGVGPVNRNYKKETVITVSTP